MKHVELEPNTLVVVTFGAGNGEQLALYVRDAGRRAAVRKWRVNGQTWTKPVYVVDPEILREATPHDFQKFRPDMKAVALPAPEIGDDADAERAP